MSETKSNSSSSSSSSPSVDYGTTVPKPAGTKMPTSGSSNSSEPESKSSSVQIHSIKLWSINIDTLGDAPKLKGSDSYHYDDWKKELQLWASSKGVSKIIFKPVTETWSDAKVWFSSYHINEKLMWELYITVHERVYGTIGRSIYEAMGTDITDAIQIDQKTVDQLNKGEGKEINFLENNSNYLWRKIQDTFEKKAGNATIQCFDELINLHWDDKLNPLQFKQKFDSLLHRLNNIQNDEIKPGQKLSEGTKFAIVAKSIPRRYDAIVQTVISTSSNPTIDQLFSALQRHYDSSGHQYKRHNQTKDSALEFTSSPTSSSSSS